MAYIKVDYYALFEAADRISEYISKYKNSMNKMNSAVVFLSQSWREADFEQLQLKWNEIGSPDSTSGKMLQSIQSYSDSIREAANKYKEAQIRAIDRANILCK